MAKRAVRRQRRATAGEPGATTVARDPAPRVWRTPAFWIGGAAIGGLVAVVAVVILLATGGDATGSASAPPAASPTADGVQGTEELEQEFAERDREQIEAMTGQAKQIVEGFTPTLAAFDRALRAGGPVPAESAQWLERARAYAAQFQESVSGETGTNVARAALRASLEGFVNAIELYRQAADAPGRRALIARAREQRDIAIRTWGAATIQIDAINIAAGFGHQHVPPLGKAGAEYAPDSLPEGTGATREG